MNIYELIVFTIYFVAMIAIGIFFFVKKKAKSEKDYFIGGRNISGAVAALSAGASDMSAWVLMGLPGLIFAFGLSRIWISIGLLIGTILAWLIVAPRLRRFAIKAGDAITVPEFLSNRFKAKNPTLRVCCAVIFVIAYCIYSASSIAACGDVFVSIIPTADKKIVQIIAAVVIVSYTLIGGFNAVCWTDFIQGMLMLMALMLVPIIMLGVIKTSGPVGTTSAPIDNFWSLLASGKFDWASISEILTGLAWGLGYFGMPHILIRYMSIKSEKEMKKSQKIGIIWLFFILLFATLFALLARTFLGDSLPKDDRNLVFIKVIQTIFRPGAIALIGGLFLSAIIAASMSTADSQLLASSSAFSSDIYKTSIRKKASNKEMLWVGRLTVAFISIVALLIALFVSNDIMQLVSAAWSIFGASFGPVILLSLFWKRFNYKGAITGIIVGFVSSILWMILFNLEYYGFTSILANTNLYELLPGFILSMLSAVIVTLATKAPSKEVVKLFESVGKSVENDEVELVD